MKSRSNLITPLARARGLGSAHDGTTHFILQRLTAIALVPLLLWLVYGLITHVGASYYVFKAWVGSFPVALALILTLIAAFWHASLGLQIIIEDYVHAPATKLASLIIAKFACFGFAVAGILAIVKLAA